MIILSVDQAEKSYGANLVLDGLSLEVQEGDRIGVVGRNGAGKTTLFKLISGMEPLDRGAIHKKKHLRIGYLEQIPEIPAGYDGLKVLQMAFDGVLKIEAEIHRLTALLGAGSNGQAAEEGGVLSAQLRQLDELQKRFEFEGGYDMDLRLARITEGLKIKQELLCRDFSDMSGGEKTRVLLGRILLEAPELLLLDEPTNHLDLEALEWLETYLASYSGAMLMISHDRQFLDQVATQILEFEDKTCRLWHGNYSRYKADRDDWMLQQVEIYKQQQKKIRSMEEAIRRFEDWGTRSDDPRMFTKARNMQKRIERMDKIDKPKTKEKQMGLTFKTEGRTGKIVFKLEDVTAGYGEKVLFSHADAEIHYQERVVLMGANGIGKTTLFKLLLGELAPISGSIRVGSRVKIGYLEQEVRFERQERTVLQLFNEETMIGEYQARGRLARFMFFSEDLIKKVSSLSGGERVRLKLCLMMEQGINVLLLDEPTNHMDIPSREVLEIALEHFEGTFLMISHDRYFIRRLAQRIWLLSRDGLRAFEGDFDEWRQIEAETEQQPERGTDKQAEQKEAPPQWRNPEQRSRQNEVRRAQKRVEELERQISELEGRLKAVEVELAAEDLPYDALIRLCDDQERLKAELDLASAEWLEQSEVLS